MIYSQRCRANRRCSCDSPFLGRRTGTLPSLRLLRSHEVSHLADTRMICVSANLVHFGDRKHCRHGRKRRERHVSGGRVSSCNPQKSSLPSDTITDGEYLSSFCSIAISDCAMLVSPDDCGPNLQGRCRQSCLRFSTLEWMRPRWRLED